MRNTSLVLLDQAGAHLGIGGKASGLARLIAAGVPVPDGFVITAAATEAFLAEGGLGDTIANRLVGLRVEEVASLHAIAEEIEALILAAPLPPELGYAITSWRREILGDAPVAVRSSALGEDGATTSFAGQLTSILNVHTEEELGRAVRRCWASRYSARVLSYQARQGTALAGMAVIVQRLVDSRLAGVLFTRAPRGCGGPDEMLVEYCHGLGEALVSGAIDPGRLTIGRTTGTAQLLRRPEQPAPSPEHLQAEERFLLQGAAALGRLALDVERRFGVPLDLEWSIDRGDRLFVVQARPITAGLAPASVGPRLVYSNANVNENFPDPLSPLLHSIATTGYTHYFRNLAIAIGCTKERIRQMEPFLAHIIGVHGGRMYYNLTNLHAVLRNAPFGAQLVEYFNLFVGAAETPSSPPGASEFRTLTRERTAAALELAGIVARVTRRFAGLEAGVARFEAAIAAYCDDVDARIAEGPDAATLLRLLQGFLSIREHGWIDASFADAASMVGYGVVKSLLRALSPDADQAGLQNDLLKGIGELVSSAPAVALFELSRKVRADRELARLIEEASPLVALEAIRTESRFAPFAVALERYLSTWGFRCPGELMLTVPSFEENPAALLPLLRVYAGVEAGSPEETLDEQRRAREAATATLLERLRSGPLRGGLQRRAGTQLLERALDFTRHAISLRERARLQQSRFYSRGRRLSLAIGSWLVTAGRLAARDDVFLFRHEELEALLVGDAFFPHHLDEQAALRRRHLAELAATTPSDTIEILVGDVLPARPHDLGPVGEARNSGALVGTSACGGKATGRASVLAEVAEAGAMRPGDILVTRQTDPAWGPVFFLIKGLVMERGGMLSHGAIIAREFGIPAVVGVPHATQRITTGATVTVDGDRGLVVVAEATDA